MTQPRAKRDKDLGLLGATAQTMVKDWYKEQIYGKRKAIDSKYLTKGNVKEQDNLVWLAGQLNLGLITETNTEFFMDEYFMGTPDLIVPEQDLVIDIKSSWDFSTFPLLDEVGGNTLYYWQVQCYMRLTGMRKAKIAYVLSNTPDEVVSQEIKRAEWKLRNEGHDPSTEELDELAKTVKAYHDYSNIPDKYKLKVVSYDYNEADVEQATEKVQKARELVNQFNEIYL